MANKITVENINSPILYKDMKIGSFGMIHKSLIPDYIGNVVFRTKDLVIDLTNGGTWSTISTCPIEVIPIKGKITIETDE